MPKECWTQPQTATVAKVRLVQLWGCVSLLLSSPHSYGFLPEDFVPWVHSPKCQHHRVRGLDFPSSWSLSLRVASNEEETGARGSLLLLEAPPSFGSHGEEEKEELLFTFLKLLRGRVVVKSAQWRVVQLVTPPTESLAAADNHKSPLAPLLNPEAEGVPGNAIWVSHS